MRPTLNLRNYSENLFTGVYHRVCAAQTRYVVVYGGSGSSKSYSVHQNEVIKLVERNSGDTLVIRKYAADLRESCFKLCTQLIGQLNLRPLFTQAFSGDNHRVTCKANGCSLIFRGIDDPEKLKSMVGISRIVVEEASQLEFADFLELNRRARGIEGIQITLILNPVSENHWIKTQLCDEGSPYFNDTTVLRFTYRDNCTTGGRRFLTSADIKALEHLKEVNENQYRIYVLAEWGVDNTDNKFCWAFSRDCIKPTEYDGENIIWASFDFNVNPLTCLVAQVFIDTRTVRVLDCVKLENSDIWKMCDRLKAMYPDAWWQVTGDATGKNRSALSPDNVSYYHIIMRELEVSDAGLKVPNSNPPIEQNRLLVNAVHKNWNVEIDPVRCKPLIYDLTYVEVGPEGEILKDRSSLKRYSDFLDCWRYLLNIAVGGVLRPAEIFRHADY